MAWDQEIRVEFHVWEPIMDLGYPSELKNLLGVSGFQEENWYGR